MLPIRTNLAKSQLNVSIVDAESKILCSSEKGSVVVDCKPGRPKDPPDENPVEAVRQSNIELPITKKSTKTKQSNNTQEFLEELHKLIESWAPQSLDWKGDRRPILYDWEVADLIKNLLKKYGL